MTVILNNSTAGGTSSVPKKKKNSILPHIERSLETEKLGSNQDGLTCLTLKNLLLFMVYIWKEQKQKKRMKEKHYMTEKD